MTTLRAAGVTRRYGGLTAVDDVDLHVSSGEVVGLIGPNGAGKTTLFACLSGAERPDAGQVLLDDQDITGMRADRRARLGLARTFQRIAVFTTMSVEDNLLAGAESRHPGSLRRGLLGRPEPTTAADHERVEQVAALLGLTDRLDQLAGTLSTGGQRMVELGRALCRDPRVLLLDEPASGLDTAETEELRVVLRQLAASGAAVLLVEHDVELVLTTADRLVAMAAGRVLADGTPDEVRRDPAVRAAYLDRAAG
jgi:branched-chain amino acid transport system ATP-binding protein